MPGRSPNRDRRWLGGKKPRKVRRSAGAGIPTHRGSELEMARVGGGSESESDKPPKINYLEEGIRLCGFVPPLFGISGVEIGFFVPFLPCQWSYLVISEAELGLELRPN